MDSPSPSAEGAWTERAESTPSDDSDREISEHLTPRTNSRRSSESPVRKRPRYDVLRDCETTSAEKQPETATTEPIAKRDDTYYMSDGSCILLVEDTLFNVHRTILSKDSSSFSAMFTLPQGSLVSEGSSDQSPIILIGDTAEEFRHFLWALYALPHELAVVHTSQAPLPRLISIAKLSNKYSFKSLELWSLDAIQEYVNRMPSCILSANPLSYKFSPSSTVSSSVSPLSTSETTHVALLTSLIRLAQLCAHPPLLSSAIRILRTLMSISIHYAYLAMTLADDLDLKELRGVAYVEVMLKADIVDHLGVDGFGGGENNAIVASVVTHSTAAPSATSNPYWLATALANSGNAAIGLQPGQPPTNLVTAPTTTPSSTSSTPTSLLPPITPAQRLRLLTGHYRLTRVWEHLRLNPPSFIHASSCGATWHQHGCTQSWVEFWKEKTRTEAVLSLPPSDVLGRLKAVIREFDRWGSTATYMHQCCRMNARKGIVDRLNAVEEGLGNVFWEGEA